jgi:hypothetical protein
VNKADTTTTVGNVQATYSVASQPVPLSATVTSAAGLVNEGMVTFTILAAYSAAACLQPARAT